MTLVRLRLTGVSPGTLQRNRALVWIRQRELSFHAHRPGHLGRGVPDSDRRRFAAVTTDHPINTFNEVTAL